jgi:hypothetical protein
MAKNSPLAARKNWKKLREFGYAYFLALLNGRALGREPCAAVRIFVGLVLPIGLKVQSLNSRGGSRA